ncbi:UBN2 domain-containing protein [Cephalotus follicularis]|uniref:UBN2 domain-containing protein n=1 Tax=Cephalotus follicularis TaxID=3775 RepID=A0A1Q3B658_CEPFO|nr:UBN2 domain-containing protein [Cephalotus follicularis]
MFSHFTTIVNSLKNLGKNYSNQELVRKILRCLPKSWTPKVTAIEEAKDLSTLPLEQFLGSLMTHETTMKNHEHVEAKKKKFIALRASKEESESDEDGDMALIISQFKKFLKSQKGKKAFKKKFPQNEESSKKEELTFYECKKAENLKNVNSNYINEIEILNVSLKLTNDFKDENENLKLEIDALKNFFSKFSNSSDKLDNLLGLQRCVFDKASLDYEEMNNVKHFNNFFVKKNESKIIRNYCGRLRHIATSCSLKKNLGFVKSRRIWVPKGTFVTNLQ